MATLYVRDVPPELHNRLRDEAKLAGRSINAEVIEALRRGLARGSGITLEDVVRKPDEIRPGHALPTRSPTASELIGQERDR